MIPEHLQHYDWYAPHLAWLRTIGVKTVHEQGHVEPSRANLSAADLRGADLRDANLRGADLRDADLSYADLRNADLRNANLRGADLRDADLSYADLRNADLRNANLRGADLRGADLSYAIGLPPVPILPQIDAAILAAIGDDTSRLDMADWHTCETTHCRAGWALHLCGAAGRELEDRVGPACAGALIYAASRPGQPVPDFYASNDDALADIRNCAAEQLAGGQ